MAEKQVKHRLNSWNDCIFGKMKANFAGKGTNAGPQKAQEGSAPEIEAFVRSIIPEKRRRVPLSASWVRAVCSARKGLSPCGIYNFDSGQKDSCRITKK